MCGRFTVLTYEEVAAVAEAVEQRLAPRALQAPGGTRAQAFPGSTIALLAPNADRTLKISQATWGFQPEWSKRLVFNTRFESALGGTGMWRDAAENGRCIIPVASFFEPHATETTTSPRTGRPMKKPYEFSDPQGAPLLLAGLQAEGRCSIVTCEPNEQMAPIHARMPLVMRFREAAAWLSPEAHLADLSSLANRESFMLSVQAERLQAEEKPSDQLTLF